MADPPPSRFQTRAFGVLFAVAAFFFFWTLSPVWVAVFLGMLLAVVASPLQRRLEDRFRGHPRLLAAGITTVTLAIGVGLVALVGFVVVRELIHFLSTSGASYASSGIAWLHSRRAAALLRRLGSSPEHAIATAQSYAASLVSHLTAVLGGVLAVTSHGAVTLIFTALTSYYLLLEGRALARFTIRILPFPPAETRALMHEFNAVAVGTLLGLAVVDLAQGALSGLGFAIFGTSRPLAWGALTAIASLVPTVGTALVCLPLALARMLSGHVLAGVGLLLYWAAVVVGFCDYVLRPWLMRGRMQLHAWLVLVSLFGGIEAFGPIGLALGPLFVSLFVAIVRIYDRNYRPPQPAGSLQPQNS
jgi:predicted PurR-regulated permease PerM